MASWKYTGEEEEKSNRLPKLNPSLRQRIPFNTEKNETNELYKIVFKLGIHRRALLHALKGRTQKNQDSEFSISTLKCKFVKKKIFLKGKITKMTVLRPNQ